jgi:ferritin
MQIIAYRSSIDIDVEFEDGVVVEGKTYDNFKNGCIGNPNRKHTKSATWRLGEESVSKGGQRMKIIAYRSNRDIDVEFEDGTVVQHKTYQNFKNGRIENQNCKAIRKATSYIKSAIERLGEESVAINGQRMRIIAYRGAWDIDVEFEDGTVVEGKTYTNFKNGRIKNSNIVKQRLGEVRIAKNGQKMQIIAYRSSIDIDVEFEDGTVVEGKEYYSFKKGHIKNPNVPYPKPATWRLGEERVAKNGQKMRIVTYRNKRDIDVEFEDGTIVRNKSYQAFNCCNIKNPNRITTDVIHENIVKQRLGEVRIAKNGQKMQIIAYRSNRDIDVEFEDGTVVKNRAYCSFRKGYIKNPNEKKGELKNVDKD